jgi:sorting nexin-1/2
LEAADTGDPLGPLGEQPLETGPSLDEQAPLPPQKEPLEARNARPTSSTSQAPGGAGLVDTTNLEDDGAGFRGPPPVQPPADTEGVKRQSQPSVSIEQAAKPTFQITVGDPHKVGDLTSSHIVYQVRTKVVLAFKRGRCDGRR